VPRPGFAQLKRLEDIKLFYDEEVVRVSSP